MKLKKDKGQSLVEVLIAILVVGLVLTAVVVAVVVAVRSSQFSRHKAQSTFLGQEAIEWIRSQRQEMPWGEFAGRASGAGSLYCLEDLEFISGSCGEGDVIDGIYLREALLTLDLIDPEVAVVVTVSWFEGNRQSSSIVETTFHQWDFTN